MSRFLIAAAFALTLASPVMAETAYLRLMDDVPLPQSYSEAPGAVVFESAEGRIVQTSASGRGPAGAAQSFYLAALPPLGWRGAAGADGLEFQRGREHLSIGFYEAAPDRSAIRFRMVSGVVP